MNKKITSSALAALMVAGSTSFTAFAAMTSGTVVIGTKAFDINYVNDDAHVAEITNAMLAGGAIYVKNFNGDWIDNISGAKVDASVIPAVTYKSVAGVETKFDAMDKDAVNTLEVKSVSAINLKEIVVTFNKSVDVTSAETVGNYVLSAGTVASATANGNTVTLKLTAAAAQQDSVTVTINDVKDLSKVAIKADTLVTAKFFDTTVPTAVSAVVTGPTTIRVNFSEPITSADITSTGNFVIDSNTYSISQVVGTVGNYYVDLTLGTVLPAGTHTITVNAAGNVANAIKDFAAFAVPKADLTVNYAADVVAPVATLTSASQNEVKLAFSKPISAATQANLVVYHTYSGNAVYQGSVSWTDSQNAVVTFATNYLPIGTATIYVAPASTSALVKDNWGNNFVATTLTSAVTSDVTAPTVTSVAVVDSTHLDVTYSEAVSGAAVAANYTLKDSAATAVAVTNAVLQTGNTFRITTAVLNGGSYALSIANIKDTSVSTNAMAAYSNVIAVNDVVRPIVTATGIFSTDNKKAVVSFSEAMATSGAASMLSASNYQVALDGTNYVDLSSLSGVTLSAGSGNKSVIINYTAAQSFASGTSKIRVGRVSDVAGNLTSGFTTDVIVSTDNVTAANITNVKAISTTKVSFDVNTALTAINVAKFNISVGGVDKAATAATYVNNGNVATVTVTIDAANKFNSNIGNLTNVNFIASAMTTALGTSNSGTVTLTGLALDYIAPSVTSITTGDTNSNGKIDKVDVVYSENIQPSSIAYDSFTVAGYTVTDVAVNNDTVTLSLKESTAPDSNAVPTVTQVKAVRDASAQHNTLDAQTVGTVAIDGAGPAITGLSFVNGGTTLAVSFSEAVTDTTLANADFTIGGTGLGGATITGFATGTTVNDNIVNITLSGATTLTAAQTLTLALSGASVVTDMATVPVANSQTAVVTFTQP